MRPAQVVLVFFSRAAAGLRLPVAATGPLRGPTPPSFSLPNGKPVILFDGVCNFCNRWVNFVLGVQSPAQPLRSAFAKRWRWSPIGRQRPRRHLPVCQHAVASRKRPAGWNRAAQRPVRKAVAHMRIDGGSDWRGRECHPRSSPRPRDDLSTFVVIDKEGFYTQSTGALRVAQALPRPALNALGTACMPLPSFVRDTVYQVVATNRYSILGRDEDGATPSCILRDDAAAMQRRFLDLNWPPSELGGGAAGAESAA